MIYLANENLIFLKPRKVAGTSFEIALSAYADTLSIVTSLPGEEHLRAQGGGAKNNLWSLGDLFHLRIRDCVKMVYVPARRQKFWQHVNAETVKNRLGDGIFQSAFKVSIVRNPFDYCVSLYEWRKSQGKVSNLSFSDWLSENPTVINSNNKFYYINNKEVINYYIRYEYLIDDVRRLEALYPTLKGLGGILMNTSAKKGIRPEEKSIAEYYKGQQGLVDTISYLNSDIIRKFQYKPPMV